MQTSKYVYQPETKSKFSVGECVLLTCWNQIFIVKEITFVEKQCYVKAINGNMEVDLYEERFQKIDKE